MNKLKLIKSFIDIFSIKLGAIKKVDNKCYKVKRWIEITFKIYYYSSAIYFVILFMFLMQPHIFDNILMKFIETIALYIIFEFIIIFIMPIEEVPCWEKSLKEKNS